MMTSTQITLARMLAAYDAWRPTGHDGEALLDEISNLFDDYGFLECEEEPDGIFVPNAECRALIQQARAEGHMGAVAESGAQGMTKRTAGILRDRIGLLMGAAVQSGRDGLIPVALAEELRSAARRALEEVEQRLGMRGGR